VLDYVLRLPDGQHRTATTTRRVDLAPGSTVAIGIEVRSVLLLDD
jgi:hypothetical protein